MSYKVLLMDVDGTLLDFNASAAKSLEILFQRRGYPYDSSVFDLYEEINQRLWERYERGEIPRDQVLTERFVKMFASLGIQEDAPAFEKEFRTALGENPFFVKDAIALLDALKEKYALYVVTNGVAATQHKRLALTGLDRYFRGLFISEEIGAQKPQPGFFDYCLSHIEPCEKEEILLVGDSLSADILGANQAGIDSCWFNPNSVHNPGTAQPVYEIHALLELLPLLNVVEVTHPLWVGEKEKHEK